MVQLIAYSQDTSTPTVLDLAQAEYIKVTKSLFDETDISSRTSDYTQTFRIPFSKTNNRFDIVKFVAACGASVGK